MWFSVRFKIDDMNSILVTETLALLSTIPSLQLKKKLYVTLTNANKMVMKIIITLSPRTIPLVALNETIWLRTSCALLFMTMPSNPLVISPIRERPKFEYLKEIYQMRNR